MATVAIVLFACIALIIFASMRHCAQMDKARLGRKEEINFEAQRKKDAHEEEEEKKGDDEPKEEKKAEP